MPVPSGIAVRKAPHEIYSRTFRGREFLPGKSGRTRAAREKVRAARALEDLPEIGASMARGELSFSKIRALTRVATPETETDLLELARGTTAHELERMIRAFRRGTREEEGERERRLHKSRSFSVFPDEEDQNRGRAE